MKVWSKLVFLIVENWLPVLVEKLASVFKNPLHTVDNRVSPTADPYPRIDPDLLSQSGDCCMIMPTCGIRTPQRCDCAKSLEASCQRALLQKESANGS